MTHNYRSLRREYPDDFGVAGDDDTAAPAEKPTGRRQLIATLVGGGLGAAALGAGTAIERVVGAPVASAVPLADVNAPNRPRDAGAFADRDASYSKGSGVPVPQAGTTPAALPTDPANPDSADPAGAAEATGPSVRRVEPVIIDPAAWDLHLLRRFTFGPTPEMVDEVRKGGLNTWFIRQLRPETIADELADQVWAAFPTARMSTPQIRAAIEEFSGTAMVEYGQATLARQIWSNRQLFEVMIDFWANHLNVPMPSDGSWDTGTPYHNDVIRKHALGTFREMLHDAMRHPAMLRYLSNNQSRKESVNENLGRELLELHTVGVDGGYTEDDVRNSAYILTGRTNDQQGMFLYRPEWHRTGAVTVLDFSDENATADGGLEVGDRYVAYLATHPSTARLIARKLAVRFVADDPPEELVARLAQVYLDTDTNIIAVLVTLVSSPEFWRATGMKTRRPLENVVASMRTLGVRPAGDLTTGVGKLYQALGQLGHKPLNWQPPNGYPDVAGAWASSGAMLRTWNLHRSLAQGAWPEFSYTSAERLHGDTVPDTAAHYLDALCERLLHQRMDSSHVDVLTMFLGDEAASGATAVTMARHLAPLVLDSPYFALR